MCGAQTRCQIGQRNKSFKVLVDAVNIDIVVDPFFCSQLLWVMVLDGTLVTFHERKHKLTRTRYVSVSRGQVNTALQVTQLNI